jgi:hypothetical protein
MIRITIKDDSSLPQGKVGDAEASSIWDEYGEVIKAGSFLRCCCSLLVATED